MSLVNSSDSLEDIKNTLLELLNRAGNDRKSPFRFIILNTIANDFPNSRYVVLRKFDKLEKELFIYTDHRSNKIEEISRNDAVSILSYDKQRKFQIKLKASARVHYQDEISQQHWHSLSGGQDAYNTKLEPGKKMSNLESAQQMKAEYDDEYFAVLCLKIQAAEILQLNGDGHIRALLDFEKNTNHFLVP